MSTQPPPVNGHNHDSEHGDLARLLELRTAERDTALSLLKRLEEHLTKAGGFAADEQQHDMRAARAFLETHGLLERKHRPVWTNRG